MIIKPFVMDALVNSYQTDPQSRLSLYALFQLFQEAAYRHAEVLGWGFDALQEKKQFWALTRAVLEIDRMPRWREELKIHTAPRRGEGIMAPRDLLMTDPEDVPLVRCTTYWIIMDGEERKPVPPADFFSQLELSPECDLCGLAFRKMRGEYDEDPLYSRRVHYSSLDMNNHVNNASYIPFLMDGLDRGDNEREIGRFQIAFHREAALGDRLNIYRGAAGDGDILLKAMAGDRESITAKITFRGNRSTSP